MIMNATNFKALLCMDIMLVIKSERPGEIKLEGGAISPI